MRHKLFTEICAITPTGQNADNDKLWCYWQWLYELCSRDLFWVGVSDERFLPFSLGKKMHLRLHSRGCSSGSVSDVTQWKLLFVFTASFHSRRLWYMTDTAVRHPSAVPFRDAPCTSVTAALFLLLWIVPLRFHTFVSSWYKSHVCTVNTLHPPRQLCPSVVGSRIHSASELLPQVMMKFNLPKLII